MDGQGEYASRKPRKVQVVMYVLTQRSRFGKFYEPNEATAIAAIGFFPMQRIRNAAFFG